MCDKSTTHRLKWSLDLIHVYVIRGRPRNKPIFCGWLRSAYITPWVCRLTFPCVSPYMPYRYLVLSCYSRDQKHEGDTDWHWDFSSSLCPFVITLWRCYVACMKSNLNALKCSSIVGHGRVSMQWPMTNNLTHWPSDPLPALMMSAGADDDAATVLADTSRQWERRRSRIKALDDKFRWKLNELGVRHSWCLDDNFLA